MNDSTGWKLKYIVNHCYKMVDSTSQIELLLKLGRTSGFMAVLTLLLGNIRWYHHIAINQVLTFCWNFHGDSTWFNKPKNNWLQIGDTCKYMYIYIYVYMHICIYNQRRLGTRPARKGVFHGIWGKSESHSSAWDWWAAFLISPFLHMWASKHIPIPSHYLVENAFPLAMELVRNPNKPKKFGWFPFSKLISQGQIKKGLLVPSGNSTICYWKWP